MTSSSMNQMIVRYDYRCSQRQVQLSDVQIRIDPLVPVP